MVCQDRNIQGLQDKQMLLMALDSLKKNKIAAAQIPQIFTQTIDWIPGNFYNYAKEYFTFCNGRTEMGRMGVGEGGEVHHEIITIVSI